MLKKPVLTPEQATITHVKRILNLAKTEMDPIVSIAWKGSFNWNDWENDLIDAIKDGVIEKIHVYSKKENGIIAFSWITLELDSLWIDSLVIDRNYHREGVGTLVLEWLIKEYVHPNKLGMIKLGVQKNNENALAFYERMGFKELSFVDRANTIIMEKVVDNH